MFKKFSVGLLIVTFLLGGAFSIAPAARAEGITIQQLVELFISLGIISPEKAAAARTAVGSTAISQSNGSAAAVSFQYHLADMNKDWKIDSSELERVQSLYGYSSGSVRTGDYHCVGTLYVAGPGDRSCGTHSADTDKDWRISLLELTRVIELKNAGGYTVQSGTQDGFAPTAATVPANSSLVISAPRAGSIYTAGSELPVTIQNAKSGTYTVQLRGKAYSQNLGTLDTFNKSASDTVSQSYWIPSSISADANPFSVVLVANGSDVASSASFTISSPSTPTQTLSVSCQGTANTDVSAAWSASAIGGSGPYSYSWSAYNDPSSYPLGSLISSGFTAAYSSGGLKQTKVTVKDSVGNTASQICSVIVSSPTSSCVDSDGGININVAGNVSGGGYSFTDTSKAWNGGQCSGDSCVAVAEGYCSNGQVTNYLYQCPSGYSVNGACATKLQTASVTAPTLSRTAWYADDSSTWPTVSTPSALTSNQAIRVKGFNGTQYFEVARGTNSGKLTSSPVAGTTQLILYIYDYSTNSYLVNDQTVNVSVTNKPVVMDPVTVVGLPAAPTLYVAPSLSTNSWYADDPSTWPTISTPSPLTGNQAIRVKGMGGEQYLNKMLGVNSAKLTSSPAAGTTQLVLYVYDYSTNSYVVNDNIVNVSVSNKPVAAQAASLQVLAPQSGNTLTIGSTYTIVFDAKGMPADGYVHIMLADENGSDLAYIKPWLKLSNPNGNNEYVWSVADFYPSVIGKNYKISVKGTNGDPKALSGAITFAGPQTGANVSGSNTASAYVSIDQVLKLLPFLR